MSCIAFAKRLKNESSCIVSMYMAEPVCWSISKGWLTTRRSL